MKHWLAPLIGLTALLAASGAMADGPAHAIAMHGAPKYPAGFSHFDYVEPAAPKGGTLRLGAVGTFDSLNPFLVKGVPAEGTNLLFERLLKRSRDEPFTLYARIAESVETPPDRSSVTFVLDARARWHDGRPITVDDVAWSWRTLKDHGRPNHRLYYAKVKRIDTEGTRRITFHLEGDDRELPMILGLMPILPRHWFEKAGFGETTLDPPLGSGPYRIARVEPGRSVTYERVPDYWGRDLPANRGHDNFDSIVFDYYRDGTVALEAFRKGLVDLREENDPGRWVTAYDTPARRQGRIVLEEIGHGRPVGMLGLVFNTRRPIFTDRRVRAALAHAFDFEWANRVLFHAAYRRTASYFENSELAAGALPDDRERALLDPFAATVRPEVLGAVYAPPGEGGRAGLEAARAGLEAAGWRFDGGRMLDAQGRPASFEILLVDPRDERLALEYGRRLGRLGIEVRVRTVDSAQFQYRLDSYDFDMIPYLYDQSLSPGNEQAFYFGSAAADQEGTRNYPGIRDPAVDAMIAHLLASRERDGLVAAARALDRLLQWGHYLVPLHHLPADRVAYWNHLARPTRTPVYGYQTDTWWHADRP